MCWIRIFETLGPAASCACAVIAQTRRVKMKARVSHGNVAARLIGHVFVTYFGRTLKTRKGLQECQVNVARWAVALLRDQEVDRHRLLFRWRRAIFVFTAARLVKQTDEVGILFDSTRLSQI